MSEVDYRNLWDHENREVYESSHSAVLALLAARAQGIVDGPGTAPSTMADPEIDFKGKGRTTAVPRPLAEKIIPFYTKCLLEVESSLLYSVPGLTHRLHSLCHRMFCLRILVKVG